MLLSFYGLKAAIGADGTPFGEDHKVSFVNVGTRVPSYYSVLP